MKRTILAAASWAAAIATAPLAANAGDGVIELSQECALAGCGTGDAAGFPIELATLGSGSYRLTSDLVVPAGTTGIFLPGSSSLDLNGFEVRGPVACADEPIFFCSAASGGAFGILGGARVRIHGGTVRGFTNVGITVGADSLVRDVRVSDNVAGGIATAAGTSIRDSAIVRNGNAGIAGNVADGSLLVRSCVVRGNQDDGIQIADGLVLDSVITYNGDYGIQAAGFQDFGYANDMFRDNNGVVDSSANQVSGGLEIGCNDKAYSGNVCTPPQ